MSVLAGKGHKWQLQGQATHGTRQVLLFRHPAYGAHEA